MSLLNFFKPKWQHSDPKVRLSAVLGLAETEQQTILDIALGDVDGEVRRAAQARIQDWRRLEALLAPTLEHAVSHELRERISTLQLNELFDAQGLDAKMTILASITQDALLARVAEEEAEADIRLAAVERMTDQGLLAEVVTKNCGKAPALKAIDKINDEALLQRLAQQAASRAARARAQQKVEEIEFERNKPSPEALRELELTNLLEQARLLTESANLELALDECRKLKRRWHEIAEQTDGRTQDVEECCATLLARQQEEVAREAARCAAQKAHAEHLERLRRIVAHIQGLATAVTGGEEETFVMLQQEWSDLSQRCLAEFPTACVAGQQTSVEPYLPDDLLQHHAEAIGNFNRSRVLLAQETAEESQLLHSLSAITPLIEAEDLVPALVALTEAQRAFDGWRPQLVSRQQVSDRLCLLRDQHRDATVRRETARVERLQANWQRRKELIMEVKALVGAQDFKQAEQRFREIKEAWRRPVDLPAEAEDLEPRFNEATLLFNEKLVAVRKQETWQRWQSKNLKAKLIAEAEALDESADLRQVFKRIKELQESWRVLGPAPAKEENALWRSFKEAIDRNFSRCRVYFQTLDDEAEHNLQEKIRLRDMAIAQQDSSEWQKTTQFIKELQAQWKAIGRTPKDSEQEVLQGFRAACDHFFARRKAHQTALEQERQVNLSQKEALCLQAEALADQPDINQKQQFKDLQAAWKNTGKVSREQEDRMWKRFRAACNRYFAWLDQLRPENLIHKEALCAEVEAITAALGPDSNFIQLAKKVVTLQRRWKDIGPVPQEQQEAIWQRFKGQCDAFYAAKNQQEEAIDRQRPENQAKKEACLSRVKELSQAPVSRETVREIIALQEEWQRLGPADKDLDRRLQEEFKAVCDTFFKERREAFQEIDNLHRDNLKKKEALCLRLEILAGMDHPVAKGQPNKGGLTLAEQLKVAFETNFVLSSDDAKHKKKLAQDEVAAIKQEWQQIGAIPREHEHSIRKRYNEALAAAGNVLAG